MKLSMRVACARMLLQIVVVGDDGWNRGEEARGGGDQRFGDARSDGAQAGGAGVAQACERVHHAPAPCRKAR